MTTSPPGFRVGWGFDAHSFNGEPPLVLGGVTVSVDQGVSATSDGDVLAHAVTDAVLGAAALGDIGDLFPSDDPESVGADSMAMLRKAVTLALASGWKVAHVDATVVAEKVRVAPHRDAIRDKLAGALGASREAVSVKATTTDGLGFTGRGEGIATLAVVTMEAVS